MALTNFFQIHRGGVILGLELISIENSVQTGPNHLNKYYNWLAVVFIQVVWPSLYVVDITEIKKFTCFPPCIPTLDQQPGLENLIVHI